MITPTPATRLALLVGPVVLLVGLTLRWYSPEVASISTPDTFTGWSGSDLLDLYLTFIALGAWGLLYADARKVVVVWLPPALDAAAALGVVLVIYRILSPPDDLLPGFLTDVSLSAGPFVALAGLLLVFWALRPSALSASSRA
ncbi:hypothetical protein DSM112329_00874 [Paraconexibacter sp. AEG42_29]|uniref:DUF4345 domain-containing protein n=1 Tax=Paraconexibacter sp. AEG42_29 TaxID=2997339 RepID=A0AAU7AR48_9ACTN